MPTFGAIGFACHPFRLTLSKSVQVSTQTVRSGAGQQSLKLIFKVSEESAHPH